MNLGSREPRQGSELCVYGPGPCLIQRFVSLLPTEEEDFKVAFFRAVWRGLESGTDAEVFHVGVEKRRLKPFIQMPVQRSSKQFVEQFKEHFSGFRVDRQEYRSDYKDV